VKGKKRDFEKALSGVKTGLIGCVSKEKKLAIYGRSGDEIVNLDLAELRQSWLRTFEEFR
jgi:hypothetical protein